MVDNGVFHYTIQGPDYDLFKVHNPENKRYIQTTVSAYALQWAPSIRYPALKKVGKGKILDLDCEHYVGDSFRPGTTVDGWFTRAIKMDDRLSRSFSKLCGLPLGYGLPVQVRIKARHHQELMFDLLKVSKTKVSTESLLVPKSYRLMQDQALFFLSDEDGSNTGVEEFMRSAPGTGKKNSK
jgi:hypothetical protein